MEPVCGQVDSVHNVSDRAIENCPDLVEVKGTVLEVVEEGLVEELLHKGIEDSVEISVGEVE